MIITINTEEEYFIPLKYKDCEGYLISNYGKIKIISTDKILTPYIDKDEYEIVSLKGNERRYTVAIHRLVCINFIGEPEGKRNIVNHKDGIRTNNFYMNLEWVTQKENVHHAIKHGKFDPNRLGKTSIRNYDEKVIRKICELISQKYKTDDIMDMLKCPDDKRMKMKSLIADVRTGRSWKHISKDYEFKK